MIDIIKGQESNDSKNNIILETKNELSGIKAEFKFNSFLVDLGKFDKENNEKITTAINTSLLNEKLIQNNNIIFNKLKALV